MAYLEGERENIIAPLSCARENEGADAFCIYRSIVD